MKVRVLMVLSLLCAAGCTWWGVHLEQTHGLRLTDGGSLAPLATRLALAGGVASIGLLFAAGMRLYGRCYVARMEVDGRSGRLHVQTVRFLGTRPEVFDASRVSVRDHHEGRLEVSSLGVPSVNAPWTSVSVGGRRLPLIIDVQGELLKGPIRADSHHET